MVDATFAGYNGEGYTHSAGGGLLGPNDFHGLAALLVTRTPLSELETVEETERRRTALRRLMNPFGRGNPLVLQTLTCLERELSGAGAMPTVHDISSGLDSEDADDGDGGYDDRYEFRGAVQSAAPLAATGATAQATANPTIGNRRLRDEEDTFVRQTATAELRLPLIAQTTRRTLCYSRAVLAAMLKRSRAVLAGTTSRKCWAASQSPSEKPKSFCGITSSKS